MRFEANEILLNNGRRCTLRPAEARDAKAMIEFLKIVSAETPFLLRNADEITFTVDGERAFLESMLNAPCGIMMIAEIEGEIAGNCALSPVGNMRRTAHRCEFAIALKRKYWGIGIGAAMMNAAFARAKAIGYKQVELEVIAGNDRAMRLYERFGFVQTGTIPCAIRYDDGAFRDALIMQKTL